MGGEIGNEVGMGGRWRSENNHWSNSRYKARQRKIWFNSLVAAYTGWKDERNDPEKAVTFGDGKPLPGDVVNDCLRILDEESVAIPWQKGDVLLIDNLAVLHSRNTYAPPRRVLASLAK